MTYAVCARWVALDAERVAAAIAVLAPASRAESGNVTYVVHRSAEDPLVFFLYEQYVDREAYEAHLASGHFQRALDEVGGSLASRERSFYETWDV